MSNRNVEGQYRYVYQGQEKDAETGMEAFEARLWDARLGRWLTVDPAGEFFSPYLGMGNNPISTIDPDGRCTKCPNNANIGDTYNHSEYGILTLGTQGWAGADGVNIMNDVIISNVSTGEIASGLSLAGTMGIDIFKNTIPNIGKYDFLLGRFDPKYATDFLNEVPSSAMGNIYERGYKESLKSISNLKVATKFGGKFFNTISYYETAENAFKGNYNEAAGNGIKATGSLISNYVPILGPLVYEGTWSFVGDGYLIKQEWYNRAVFGVHSQTYRERGYKYGYIESIVLGN